MLACVHEQTEVVSIRAQRKSFLALPHIVGVLLATYAAVACAVATALPDPLEAGWRGDPVCEQLHKSAGQRILRCTFPPGVGHERHFHAAHFGYAISGGRMRIIDENGTRELDLPTGSSYSSAGVPWHEILNIGDSTVIYLIAEPLR